MVIERQTAWKVKISEITSGNWVKKEGMEASYVETAAGMKVSRARVLGTVVNVFLAEDGAFASVTVDDSSDTIRAKTFKTTKPIEGTVVGDIVDMIGKVKEWNDEIYMIPETMTKVEPNTELLRRLEIASRGEVKQQESGSPASAAEQKPGEDREKLRAEVLKLIDSEKEGVRYSDIIAKVKAPEETLESIVNELLGEGICYEPSPGKIRKI